MRARVAVVLTLNVLAAAAVRAQPAEPPPIAGETIVGKGVTETVQDIMAREAALVPEPFRVRESKPEHPVLLKERANPAGPAVPRWPPAAPGAQAPGDTRLPQVVGTSFLGARLSESGFVPPDSMGDVGPSQVMVVANGRIKIFDKAGNLGGLNTSTNNFFSSVGGAGNGTSDPHVRYDRLSQRWFVSIITVTNCPNDVLLAVSSGPVITSQSSFTFFRFQGESGAFVDYDTLGLDRFALYLGSNVFNCNLTFRNTTAWVVNKADLVAGTLTVTAFRGLISFSGPSCVAGVYSPQGVSNDDPQATQGYIAGVDACDFNELVLHRVTNPGGTPSLSARMTLVVPTTSLPIPQVQPSGPTLDALDDRLFAVQVHTNALTGARTIWTAHNIEVNSGGVGQQGGGRNGSRWYEIGGITGTPTLVQAGTLFDSSGALGYWIPALAMSRQGHMALVAGRAGFSPPGGFASVAVAGRLRTDPLGFTQAPTLAQSSTSSYDTSLPDVPERWGDYAQVGVDPTDGQTMWTFQEYCDASNSWGVRAIQLLAPPPATPATANPASIGPGLPSVNVVITGTAAGGAEFFDPGADAGGPGFSSRLRATVPGLTVNSTTFNSPTQVTLNLSTVGSTVGAKNVTVTNPDGQSRTGSGILSVTCPVVTVQPATIPGATLGAPYGVAFTQSGGVSPASFGLTGGLPTGMTFTAATATLSGTPTQGGSFPFTVNVTDAAGCIGSRAYTLVVSCPPLSVNPLTLPTGKINAAFTQVFTGSGATSPLTFSQTGTLPAGLSFNTGSATLSGTPTQSGAFLVTVGITDAFACTASRTYNLAIADAAALTPTALAVDTAGNGVLEANEAVVVDPSWSNQTGGPVDLTGAASSFIGPAGATYTLVDATAAYGTIADGAVGRCSTAGGDCYSVSIAAASRPASHWDPSFVESLSAGGPKAWTLHVGGSFTDVPSTSPFYRFVEILVHRSITGGCNAGLYCPTNPTGRDAMAVFVLVAKEGAGYVPPACGTPIFNDVPAASPFCRWIEELARRGVVGGCGGGNYCPTQPVTREQMAVFVLRTLDPALDPPACTTPIFNDVPATSPFCRWIEELVRRNVVTGCSPGLYCPTAPVTREQIGVFISVTFGLTLYGV
jgi:hypothetical protein